MDKKVLLIGRNLMVLKNLEIALAEDEFHVQTTGQVEQAASNFNAADFDVVAFGRGLNEATNASLRTSFLEQNPQIRFVNGLAPVIPLLVRQIKLALSESQVREKQLANFSYQQTDKLSIQVDVLSSCQLTIDLYQLDAGHHTHKKTLVDEFVMAGKHAFSIDKQPSLESTINFLVAETDSLEFLVLPLL